MIALSQHGALLSEEEYHQMGFPGQVRYERRVLFETAKPNTTHFYLIFSLHLSVWRAWVSIFVSELKDQR
jgi:hypothetical protein